MARRLRDEDAAIGGIAPRFGWAVASMPVIPDVRDFLREQREGVAA